MCPGNEKMKNLIVNLKLRPILFPVLIFCCVLDILGSNQVQADNGTVRNFGKQCAGTYLVDVSNGNIDLWSFTSDGVFFGTSSGQGIFNFSDFQGAWKKTSHQEIIGTVLDFSFGDGGELINIARFDTTLRFLDRKCEEVEGEIILLFFELDENPLDINSDNGDPLEFTFIGRRVTVN